MNAENSPTAKEAISLAQSFHPRNEQVEALQNILIGLLATLEDLVCAGCC